MKPATPVILLCIALSVIAIAPGALAVEPLWTAKASPGIELSSVTISADGSTILAGGGQLIALTGDGNRLWTGWSGVYTDMSRDGNYIVTSQGQTVRLFNREGVQLWVQSIGSGVADVSIAPDATMVAAGGGSVVQAWYNSGAGLGRNSTETVHDIRISPSKDQIIVATSRALRSFNMSYVPLWYDDLISPDTVTISGDGTGIAVPNGNHLRLYHGSGTLLWDQAIPGGNIISLAYSRDGSTIVVGRDDGSILAFNRAGNLLWRAKAGFWVTSVDVSDDGGTTVAGTFDQNVFVFDKQGRELGAYRTTAPIKARSVAVSGDGRKIVAVDISTVYGFSRSQFAVPLQTPSQSPSVTPVNSVPGVPTPADNVTGTVTGPVPAASQAPAATTPASAFPVHLSLLVLAPALALWHRKS